MHRLRLLAAVGLLLMLAACAGVKPRDEPNAGSQQNLAERAAALQALHGWDLEARVAISDGQDGGSGRLTWRSRPQQMALQFRGAFGRGGWELVSDEYGSVLRTADGHMDRDASLDALVARNAGWSIPVESLYWWVQGLAAPWPLRALQLNAEGQPERLEQDGWEMEYGDYRPLGGSSVPMRLVARSGERHVKLAISRWQVASPDADD